MASTYYIGVTAGQTVHLRSSATTQSSNVITELPRGYPVEFVSSLDPFKKVKVWDCIDTISGYVHRDYLSLGQIACSDDELWIPRYSTPSWKRSSHSSKYYLPVEKIQQDLINLGYTQISEANGYYDSNTENAVKAFQTKNGLTSDGIFGKNSKKKLWSLVERKG